VPARADVVIVGGGYTGISAARALARAGALTVVLDRETPGWGASTRNGGFVLPGFKRDLSAIAGKWGPDAARQLFAESLESIDFLESLVAEEGIACQFRRTGHIALAESPIQLEGLRKERDFLISSANHPTRLLDRAELEQEIVSPKYIGGLLDESAGSVQPAELFAGLLQSAMGAGAMIAARTEAVKLEKTGSGFRVHTTRGPIESGRVVVATNGYSGQVYPPFRRRVIPIGSHIIATGPLPPELRTLIPRERVFSDSRHLLHYFRLYRDGRMVFGGRATFRPDRTGADPRAAEILRRDMIATFPGLAKVPVEHAWSGNVAFTRDQMPHAANHDGVIVVGGYCGHGVAMAIYLGNRVGQHLAQGADLPFLASLAFPVVPLYNGHPWFLPLVGAWYQWLDRTRSQPA
jgi:glycine/D-amino acid oxidase-like deaminating enzyme